MRHNIFVVLAMLALGWMGSACSSEQLSEPSGGVTVDGVPTLAISIGVDGATRADGDPAQPDFELGSDLENYLDIPGNDYRIYFFDYEKNTYLATFTPTQKPVGTNTIKDPLTGVETVCYRFWGEVPKEVTDTKFKLVFLANWKNYPVDAENAAPEDYKLVKGKTTIADIVTNSGAQFKHLNPGENEPWLSQSERLIPFYGVRAYDLRAQKYVDEVNIVDNKIKGDVYIDLSQDPTTKEDTSIPLIRAMAKIEVILDNAFASFSKVEMTRINDKGFCAPYSSAPDWKFDYDDYFIDNKYNWEKDFTRILHLVGGKNDEQSPESSGLPFKKVSSYQTDDDGNVTSYEKWVAYVPEFRNIGEGNAYTAIKVTLANPDSNDQGDSNNENIGDQTASQWKDPWKLIYFATNGSEPSNNNDRQASQGQPGRYNIERNNIYRFKIKEMTVGVNLTMDVSPYSSVILEPEFGLDRDENGNIIYPSSNQ